MVFSATTRGHHDSPKLQVMKLDDPDRFNPGPPSRRRLLLGGSRTYSCKPGRGDWFSSAAKPDPASTVFVVGGDLGAAVVTHSEGQLVYSNQNLTQDETNPVLSVDWLNSNIFISGDGAGCVRLTDVRISKTALRFKHPAAIVRVKNLGADKMIVAGLSNAVSALAFSFSITPSHR